MLNVAELLVFVKDQNKFHLDRAEDYVDNKFRNKKHLETAAMFLHLAEYLESTSQKFKMAQEKIPLSVTPAELEDLPEELKKQLSISTVDKAEYAILTVLEANSGILSLDQILVNYYKVTGEVVKRAAMTNRLYRMAQRNIIYSVPGKKGVYSLKEVTPEDIKELLGG